MKVVVDTSVWSVALRRRRPAVSESTALQELILENRVQLLGPVRQEVLTGIRDDAHFERLERYLATFEDLELSSEDYVVAARFCNVCGRHGLQGSNTDFLICAASVQRSLEIFTTDQDFSRFAAYIPIALMKRGDVD